MLVSIFVVQLGLAATRPLLFVSLCAGPTIRSRPHPPRPSPNQPASRRSLLHSSIRTHSHTSAMPISESNAGGESRTGQQWVRCSVVGSLSPPRRPSSLPSARRLAHLSARSVCLSLSLRVGVVQVCRAGRGNHTGTDGQLQRGGKDARQGEQRRAAERRASGRRDDVTDQKGGGEGGAR